MRKKQKKLLIILALFLALAITVYTIIDNAVRPIVMEISKAKVHTIALTAIGESVNKSLKDSIQYEDIVNITKDADGRITMIQANVMKMNALASIISENTRAELNDKLNQGVSIPIGTILGGQLFSGLGPPVKIRYQLLGVVQTGFYSEFESAGINQTRHKIFLKVSATMSTIIPRASQTVEATRNILVAETVIVGNVPDMFFGSNSGGTLNFAPKAE